MKLQQLDSWIHPTNKTPLVSPRETVHKLVIRQCAWTKTQQTTKWTPSRMFRLPLRPEKNPGARRPGSQTACKSTLFITINRRRRSAQRGVTNSAHIPLITKADGVEGGPKPSSISTSINISPSETRYAWTLRLRRHRRGESEFNLWTNGHIALTLSPIKNRSGAAPVNGFWRHNWAGGGLREYGLRLVQHVAVQIAAGRV